MASAFTVSILIVSCYGFGAGGLRALGLRDDVVPFEQLLWSFVFGLGGLGWIAFFLGIGGQFTSPGFLALTLAGVILAAIYKPSWTALKPDVSSQTESGESRLFSWVAGLCLTLIFLFDLAEGLSPPADADSMSYHFALPKLFNEWGRVVFVPIAIEGATPLLLHMTHAVAFGLGGELAVTLWVMISGWAATALVYCIVKPHVGRTWGLAAALIFATTPAVIYGAGTGQVEIRNALFVMVATSALAKMVRTGDWRFVVVAALMAGFFAGSKYTGLLFVAAAGLTLLTWRRNFLFAVIFGVVAFVAGGQWYLWNWLHTGDPIFPLLFSVLEYKVAGIWDQAHHAAFQNAFFVAEKAVPANFFEFVAYPFRATLNPPSAFEALRIGFGPFGLLILPFAVSGAWLYRNKIRTSQISVFAVMALFFYTLWFFTGSSQRVRHLLPLYPLVLVCLIVAAHRWSRQIHVMTPFAAVFVLVGGIQIGGHLIFTMKFFDYLFGSVTRAEYVDRNVSYSASVSWINENLTDKNRIYVDTRNILYFLNVPYFYGHPYHQAQVNTLPSADDPTTFLSQLRRLGIDHVLISNWPDQAMSKPYRGILGLAGALLASECAEIAYRFVSNRSSSRTLPNLHTIRQKGVVLRLKDNTCQLKI